MANFGGLIIEAKNPRHNQRADSTAKAVLARIADSCNDRGVGMRDMAREWIAEDVGISYERLRKVLRFWQHFGLLAVCENAEGGRGHHPTYEINVDELIEYIPVSRLPAGFQNVGRKVGGSAQDDVKVGGSAQKGGRLRPLKVGGSAHHTTYKDSYKDSYTPDGDPSAPDGDGRRPPGAPDREGGQNQNRGKGAPGASGGGASGAKGRAASGAAQTVEAAGSGIGPDGEGGPPASPLNKRGKARARDAVIRFLLTGEVDRMDAMAIKAGLDTDAADKRGPPELAQLRIPSWDPDARDAALIVAALPYYVRSGVSAAIAWALNWIAGDDPNEPAAIFAALTAHLRDYPSSDYRDARIEWLRAGLARERGDNPSADEPATERASSERSKADLPPDREGDHSKSCAPSGAGGAEARSAENSPEGLNAKTEAVLRDGPDGPPQDEGACAEQPGERPASEARAPDREGDQTKIPRPQAPAPDGAESREDLSQKSEDAA